MNRREIANGIAEAHAGDGDWSVRVIGLADGVVALFRGTEEVAFKVLEECQGESEEAAIGRSKAGGVWCVTCPGRAAFDAVRCRVAEELHLFEGLESALARDGGVSVEVRGGETLEGYAAGAGRRDEVREDL